MGRSVEVVDGRIVSRRVGGVDWQDAMDSAEIYVALFAESQATELVMDMAEADLQIPFADASSLGEVFANELPEHVAIAMVKPRNRSGARAIEAFVDTLSAAGRHVATVRDLAEADAFFRKLRALDPDDAPEPEPTGGIVGWLGRIFGGSGTVRVRSGAARDDF
ncbi:hypothetical protein DDZ18_10425 [Marinicauda salina]|uniref:Uncharacterized protein n=1 Tax=Marinicauda salina TaxID=2135793 RepID=A0A2U2BSW6_9PROT|nr:hypothetical protein [Marinicauda salina]PWE17105.1 hypothetical protein DDZ18_10425 [Marinicauda salina]